MLAGGVCTVGPELCTVVAGAVDDDEPPTAAAAAVAYRTGNAAGGLDDNPFFTMLDIGCDEADIGGGGFGATIGS